MGRAGHEDILQQGDPELCQLAQDELNSILGISAEPLLKRIHRCGKALPQYNLGHSDRLAALGDAMGGLPGIFLTGAAYRGVGLPDCIKQAALTAAEAITFFADEDALERGTPRVSAGTARESAGQGS